MFTSKEGRQKHRWLFDLSKSEKPSWKITWFLANYVCLQRFAIWPFLPNSTSVVGVEAIALAIFWATLSLLNIWISFTIPYRFHSVHHDGFALAYLGMSSKTPSLVTTEGQALDHQFLSVSKVLQNQYKCVQLGHFTAGLLGRSGELFFLDTSKVSMLFRQEQGS